MMKTRDRGFTLIEMLVTVAIVGVLAALVTGQTQKMIKSSKATQCLGNMRALGAATMSYASDNDMSLPVTSHQRRTGIKSWTITLQEYAPSTLAFRCPCDEDKTRPYTYVMNDFLTPNPAGAPELNYSRLTLLETPARTLLFMEASQMYTNSDHFHFTDYVGQIITPSAFSQQVATERHDGASNYLFADGHVELQTWKAIQKLLTGPQSVLVDPTAALN